MDAGWIRFIPCLHDLTMKILKEWEAHGSWEFMPEREIAHQVYCEPLPLFRASTVGLPSRLYIEGQTTWEGSEISSPPSSAHHEPASTSSWIRRCNRQYIFLPQSTLVSRCRARDEKFLSQTGSQAPSVIAANSVSSLPQQRLDPSRGGQMIAPILSGKGTNERSFSQRKRLTMNALHSLENRAARALRPTHKSCVSSGVRNADTDRHTS